MVPRRTNTACGGLSAVSYMRYLLLKELRDNHDAVEGAGSGEALKLVRGLAGHSASFRLLRHGDEA